MFFCHAPPYDDDVKESRHDMGADAVMTIDDGRDAEIFRSQENFSPATFYEHIFHALHFHRCFLSMQ